jgi:YbbR domain-containing protein
MAKRDIILKDFWLKSFSLVLAIMIWLAIHSNLQTESADPNNPFRAPDKRNWVRPIMLMTAADDHRAYVVEPLAVNIKLNGDTEELRKLSPNDIQVYVDLTEQQLVHGAFPVKYKLPRNIALQSLWPSHVHVEPAKAE